MGTGTKFRQRTREELEHIAHAIYSYQRSTLTFRASRYLLFRNLDRPQSFGLYFGYTCSLQVADSTHTPVESLSEFKTPSLGCGHDKCGMSVWILLLYNGLAAPSCTDFTCMIRSVPPWCILSLQFEVPRHLHRMVPVGITVFPSLPARFCSYE